MQTFLPFESFIESAHSIDKKRAWKQVVEVKQIVAILEGAPSRQANHPAIKMWVGHTDLLKNYFNVFLRVCKEVHNINTTLEPYQYSTDVEYWEKPWWLGNADFHRAMRARLIEKDKPYYLPLFPDDEMFNEGKYFWPVMETETFRVI